MIRGDCYGNAVRFVMDDAPLSSESKYRIVHGIPMLGGVKEGGERYGHAWIEYDEDDMVMVYDPYNDMAMPKAVYYKLGGIDYSVIYSWAEAREMLIEEGHYGPWDEKVSEAVHS